MAEKNTQCAYNLNNKKCTENVYNGGDYCVFHAGRELLSELGEISEVDREKLKQVGHDKKGDFEQIVKNFDKGKRLYDFSGFVFPNSGIVFEIQEGKINLKNSDCDFEEAVFTGDAYFEGSKFLGLTKFFRSQFLEEAYFEDSIFQSTNFKCSKFYAGALFERCKFTKAAKFNDVSFRGDIKFTGSEFEGKTEFDDSYFDEEANFEECLFSERVSFTKSQFYRGVNFKRSEFERKADFSSGTFEGGADFTNCIFKGGVNFEARIFEGRTSFCESEFLGDTNFASSRFKNEIDFKRCKFSERANFIGRKFHEKSFFNNCNFLGYADFINCDFDEKSNFNDCQFKGCSFDLVTFKDVDLSGITVEGNFNFGVKKITGKLKLNRPTFEKPVNIERSSLDKLEGVLKINKLKYEAHAGEKITFNQVEFGVKADFTNTNCTRLSFVNMGLEKADFFGSDLLGTRFEACDWVAKETDRYTKVYEHDKKIQKKDDKKLGLLESLYRQLKKNHEENFDFRLAGDFHYREMEVRILRLERARERKKSGYDQVNDQNNKDLLESKDLSKDEKTKSDAEKNEIEINIKETLFKNIFEEIWYNHYKFLIFIFCICIPSLIYIYIKLYHPSSSEDLITIIVMLLTVPFVILAGKFIDELLYILEYEKRLKFDIYLLKIYKVIADFGESYAKLFGSLIGSIVLVSYFVGLKESKRLSHGYMMILSHPLETVSDKIIAVINVFYGAFKIVLSFVFLPFIKTNNQLSKLNDVSIIIIGIEVLFVLAIGTLLVMAVRRRFRR